MLADGFTSKNFILGIVLLTNIEIERHQELVDQHDKIDRSD